MHSRRKRKNSVICVKNLFRQFTGEKYWNNLGGDTVDSEASTKALKGFVYLVLWIQMAERVNIERVNIPLILEKESLKVYAAKL